ncbi:MAG: hypothetical protein JWM28_1221, partial [Chitinophagaceae bacterium]|nr:hypothetical protein [Chitinophagaceae bacterium]
MKIVLVSFFYNETLTTEEELLQHQYTITGWSEALQRRNIDLIVVSRFRRE